MFVNVFCFVLLCVGCVCVFFCFAFLVWFQKCNTVFLQHSIEHLRIHSFSGRSEEDGSSTYRVRSKELFLVYSELF